VPGLVDNFSKQFEAVTVPYPKDTASATIAEQQKQIVSESEMLPLISFWYWLRYMYLLRASKVRPVKKVHCGEISTLLLCEFFSSSTALVALQHGNPETQFQFPHCTLQVKEQSYSSYCSGCIHSGMP